MMSKYFGGRKRQVRFRSVVSTIKLENSTNEANYVTYLHFVHWKAECLMLKTKDH